MSGLDTIELPDDLDKRRKGARGMEQRQSGTGNSASQSHVVHIHKFDGWTIALVSALILVLCCCTWIVARLSAEQAERKRASDVILTDARREIELCRNDRQNMRRVMDVNQELEKLIIAGGYNGRRSK